MFAASFVALALAAVGAHAQLQLNTPGAGLTECQNFQFSWQGNTGPVQILCVPSLLLLRRALISRAAQRLPERCYERPAPRDPPDRTGRHDGRLAGWYVFLLPLALPMR